MPEQSLPVEIVGLTPAAVAWRLAERYRADPRRTVIVTPGRDVAHELADALAFFTAIDPTELPVIVEPVGRPYQALNPEFEWELETATALARLAEGFSWSFLVVSAQAFLRKVPRPSTFRRRVRLLEAGAEVSRDELVDFLEQAGYSQRDAAESPGTYAARGGLVEVFAPFYSDPIRIDLFGDTIDSLHFFDADSLARKRRLDVAALSPVSVLLLDDEARLRALGAIRDLGARAGLPSERLDEIATAVSLDGRPPGYLNYFGAFYAELVPIVAYVPADATWAVLDHHEVEEVVRGFEPAARASHAEWTELGELALAPDALFAEPQAALGPLSGPDVLRYTRVQTDPTAYRSVRPPVRDLGDLRARLLAARKAREPEFRELVAFVRDVLFKRHHRVAFVVEARSRARQVKRVLNLEGIKCELEGARRTGADEIPAHPVIRRGRLVAGFHDEQAGVAWVSERDLFDQPIVRLLDAPAPAWDAIHKLLSEFRPGDLVVHDAYGIGRYRGIVRKRVDGVEADFVQVDYRDDDRVLLPVYKVDRLQRYVAGKGAVALDKLGSNAFDRRKERVRKALERVAEDLVALYAERRLARRDAILSDDEACAAFDAAFAFDLTDDQQRALRELLGDLGQPHPMDRLLCGDVGFGKTELALRAAFRVAVTGRQVAVLVPTTVLAEQHRQTFAERMEPFGLKVEGLTRFRSAAEGRQVLRGLQAGVVDVVIGTHRLLQGDVHFRDLGLLVVDEEHRFGVQHKEAIKKLRTGVDVLAMTATPIPRSLEMSLSGIRDLSVIATAPEGRQAVRTVVTRFNGGLLQEAIRKELARGGKVFFVHNRIDSLPKVREILLRLVPEARVVVGHGRMGARELEDVMVAFARGDADVLLSTSIVESGLDIPVANTMIINQAHRFGLSELHQLRGRVGRSSAEAVAYLLIPGERVLSSDARKRLRSIQAHAELGAGFRLAMEDLEIRGSGNLLGEAQSGHVEAVGFSLYMSMLEQAISAQKGLGRAAPVDTTVRVPVPAFLPAEWFPDDALRVSLYQRIASARSFDALRDLEEELARHGDELPLAVRALLDVARLRIRASKAGATDVIVLPRRVIVRFAPDRENEWRGVVNAIAHGDLAFLPSGDREVSKELPVTKEERLLAGVRIALKPLWACARDQAPAAEGEGEE